MKKDLHPAVNEITASCTCGNQFKTTSTLKDINVTLCSKCHPFFTGEQKHVDTAGRIEKFRLKYSKEKQAETKNKPQPAEKSKNEAAGKKAKSSASNEKVEKKAKKSTK